MNKFTYVLLQTLMLFSFLACDKRCDTKEFQEYVYLTNLTGENLSLDYCVSSNERTYNRVFEIGTLNSDEQKIITHSYFDGPVIGGGEAITTSCDSALEDLETQKQVRLFPKQGTSQTATLCRTESNSYIVISLNQSCPDNSQEVSEQIECGISD